MRRLLVVAYYFPPEAVAGALRPSYLASYLPEFGWEATVLTRQLGDELARHVDRVPVVTAPVIGDRFERSIRGAMSSEVGSGAADVSARRRALRWIRKTLSFPDRAIGWLPVAIARGCALAHKQRVDAVLSTATPATAHLVAFAIARRCGVPWIADYRDPWSGNPGAQEGRVRASLQLQTERFVVRNASAITTISEPIAGLLKRIHHRSVAVIPNASEPRDWEGLGAIEPSEFLLTYTGCMYAEHRSPALLFQALAALRAEGHPAGNARVLFLGPANDHLLEEARRFGVADIVTYGGVVQRSRALAAQREASNLLIFLNMDPSSQFELGSKIIEYMRARRPILAFGPPASVVRDYIDRHELGWFAHELEQAKAAVREAYSRFMSGNKELPPPRERSFDARDLAGAFAAQLAAVT